MYTKIFILFVGCCFFQQCYAQDSLVNIILSRENKLPTIKNVIEKIDCYNLLSQDYFWVDSIKSMEYLEKGYALSSKINDYSGLSFYNNILSVQYLDHKQYDLSVKHSIDGAKYALLAKDTSDYLECIYRQAVALYALKLYDSLINLCKFSLYNIAKEKFNLKRGKLFHIMGWGYLEIKSPLAVKYLNQSVELIQSQPDKKFLISAYTGLMKYYFNTSKSETAVWYAKKALGVAKLSVVGEVDYIQIASMMYALNAERGNFLDANDLNQSVYSATQAVKNKMLYLEKKIVQVKLLEVKSKEAFIQKIYLTAAIVGMIILFAVGFIYNIKAKQKKRELELLNQELVVSLNNNNVLLKEVHHRVRNNFQTILGLLYLQGDVSDNQKNVEFINTMTSRIETISEITEHLYYKKDMGSLKIIAYLNWLIKSVISNFNIHHKQIDYLCDGYDIELDASQLVPVGLIVNELLINSMKHAFNDAMTGYIQLRIKMENDQIMLQYEDNGKGFIEQAQSVNKLGMQLITALLEQLKGSWVIDTKYGFKATIYFKYAT